MKSEVSLGRIFGMRLALHYIWFFLTILLILLLAGIFRARNPEWAPSIVRLSATVTGLLFLCSMLAREFSHSIVARSWPPLLRHCGPGLIPQNAIRSTDAKIEFLVGIGPLITNVLIGLTSLALAWAIGWEPLSAAHAPVQSVFVWLGYTNMGLGVLSIIPGCPPDGGRALRATLWWATGDLIRSMRIAAITGQVVAVGLMTYGAIRFLTELSTVGLWTASIGWFLYYAAQRSTDLALNEHLCRVRVGDAMTRDCFVVDGRLSLHTFVEDVLLNTGRRCFVVEEKGRLAGLVTPHDIKRIARTRWPYVTIDGIMRPLEEIQTVSGDAPVMRALQLMEQKDVNQLLVTNNGCLEGVVSRSNILRLLQRPTSLSE